MTARARVKAIVRGALAGLVLAAGVALAQAPQPAPRERIDIDRGWKFAYGHATDPERDFGYGTRPFFFAKAGYGDGPAAVDFSDAGWRRVDLPHDWAVELPFDARGDGNHGSRAIGRHFPENSVGWYRKVIDIPASAQGRRIALEFDGVYRDSVVWVNGHYMGTEPSGYSGFRYDITDYVNYGAPNVIAVRADASREEGWFYEGAGIYRHVWLTTTAPLHVAPAGTFVRARPRGDGTAPDAGADVDVDVAVDNNASASAAFTIEHEVVDADGRTVAHAGGPRLTVDAAASVTGTQHLAVARPRLWSTDDPYLYRLRTRIRRGADLVDEVETTFGIRSAVFDPERGFVLNGKPLKLRGTNNHQDHAGVGVALPDGLQAWRLRQLKAIGVNAYRTSHHPPTPELLDAADRLGILVIDEHRMMGTTPEIAGQLERMVRRDRNHPSVILWSVGNEEWALENKPLGERLARAMHDIVARLDPTRRTTVATSASGKGVSLGADVIGFNYGAQHDVDAFHRAHPDKPAVMTEEGATTATRGVYVDAPERVHLAAYDREARPGHSLNIEEGWRRVQARPWMAGMFVWTGFDYRGETTPFGWPAISSQFGMLDTTGVRKDSAYYLQAWWRAEPMVHILPHWNWPGREGQAIDVRVYSNGDEVELLQDGHSLGRRAVPPDGHLAWSVIYRPGRLTARAWRAGRAVASETVATTGAAAALHLAGDTPRLRANGSDVAVVWVNVRDGQGRRVPTADQAIAFETAGPLRIIGVGNGDPGSHEPDRPAERHVFTPLSGWRTRGAATRAEGATLAGAADTEGWRDPARWLPPEQEPPATPVVVLRGRFARPRLDAGQSAVLFLDRVGADQQVFVNGRAAATTLVDDSPAIVLDGRALDDLGDVNSVSYVLATPAGGVLGMAGRSVGGTRWGTVRVTTAAQPWRRSLFNGWAQVIVQSTGQAGSGTLSARAPGLAPASLRLEVGP